MENLIFFNRLKSTFSKIERITEKEEIEKLLNEDYEKIHQCSSVVKTKINNEILAEYDLIYKLLHKCGINNKEEMSSLIIKLFYIYEKTKILVKK